MPHKLSAPQYLEHCIRYQLVTLPDKLSRTHHEGTQVPDLPQAVSILNHGIDFGPYF